MTARLWLLCHAATPANRAAAFPRDEPIEERERARLAGLAARLPRSDRVLTAPALRARQTAAAVAPDRPATVEEALRDGDCGRWAGRTLKDVFAAEPEAAAAWIADPRAAPHGGESVAALIERIGAWLDGTPFTGRTLAVTHAAVMRAALAFVLRAPPESVRTIDVAPLALLDFTHDGRRWAWRCPVAG